MRRLLTVSPETKVQWEHYPRVMASHSGLAPRRICQADRRQMLCDCPRLHRQSSRFLSRRLHQLSRGPTRPNHNLNHSRDPKSGQRSGYVR